MKKIMFGLSLVAVLLLSAVYVYAQQTGLDPKPEATQAWQCHKGFFLTPDQKAKFMEMHRMFIKENAQLVGAIVTKKLELQALWTDPKSDPKAILDKEKEFSQLRDQMRDKAFRMMLEVRKILTPEQIAHWKPGLFMHHRGMMRHGCMMGYCHGMGHQGEGF